MKLKEEFGFAMLPVLVPVTDGMMVKSLDDDDSDETPAVPSELYVTSMPNPFNATLRIQYGVPVSSEVSIGVYDVRGRLVRRLVNRSMAAGNYSASWNGRDDSGRNASSGVYFIKVNAGANNRVQRVSLVK